MSAQITSNAEDLTGLHHAVEIWQSHLRTARSVGARESHIGIIEDRINELKDDIARHSADAYPQKIVWSDAVNDAGKAYLIMDAPVARASLLRMVTGSSKEIPQTVEDVADVLVKCTGMAVDPDVVMIPLHIFDSPCAEPNQLWDEKLKRDIEIAHYWPYAWFVDAIDGNVPEVPLWGGRFLARLYLTSQEGSAQPFHIQAAVKAAKCLSGKEHLSNAEVADIIERYYGIDIEGLRR